MATKRPKMAKKQPNAVPGDIVIISINHCSSTRETRKCRGLYAVVDSYTSTKNNEQVMCVKFINKEVKCEIDNNRLVKHCELADSELVVVNNCEHLIVKDDKDTLTFICKKKSVAILGTIGLGQCFGKPCYWRRKPPVPSNQERLDKYSNPNSSYTRK